MPDRSDEALDCRSEFARDDHLLCVCCLQLLFSAIISHYACADGMTETSPVSTQSRIGDSLEQQAQTVGRVHQHLEVKVVDEHGRFVGFGLIVRISDRFNLHRSIRVRSMPGVYRAVPRVSCAPADTRSCRATGVTRRRRTRALTLRAGWCESTSGKTQLMSASCFIFSIAPALLC